MGLISQAFVVLCFFRAIDFWNCRWVEGAVKYVILLPLVFLQTFVIPSFHLGVFQYFSVLLQFAYTENVVCLQAWGAGNTLAC